MRILLYMVLAGAMFTPIHASAADTAFEQITGARLQSLFTGKTVISEYQDTQGGIKDFRFTEHHYKDGTTDYIERGQKTEKGLWNIIGQKKICYRYPSNKTFNGTYCFFVFKEGQCYYNYSLAAMTLTGPKNRDWWTSRFVVKGEGGSCEAVIS